MRLLIITESQEDSERFHQDSVQNLKVLLESPAVSELIYDGDAAEPRAELAHCLRPMIERLSKDYRDAINLVELEGLTQQAAATQIGVSLSGMKSRVQRGRKQLKQMLDDCCLIELDRRRAVVDYKVRDTECNSCKPSSPKADK